MNIKKYSWMAVLPLLLSACQDDALVGNVQQQGIYTLSGKMSAGSPLSRAQIELGNSDQSQEVAFWNEGDCISVYQEISESFKEYVFNISSDYKEATAEDKSTALFTSSIPAHGGNSYVAVYPGKKETNGSSMTLGLEKALYFNDGSKPEYRASIWKDYFKKNMYMMASGTFSDEASASVEFKHLCALARITYTNKTGAAQHINQFRLLGQTFNNQMTIDLVEGKVDSLYSDNQMVVSTNNLIIADGDSADVYMLFFPSTFGEGDLTLWAKDVDDKEKTVSMPISTIADANPGATGFEAGKRYWFKVTDIGEELVWSKDYSEALITIPNVELSAVLYEKLDSGMVVIDETTGYAQMTQKAVNEVTSLSIEDQKYNITSLEGIEHFKNLTYLSCIDQFNLTSCDLSQNTALETVSFQYTGLTSLDLSNHDRMDQLICYYNTSLGSLKVSEKARLYTCFNIANTAISNETLTVTEDNLVNLTQLEYGHTNGVSFDLTNFKNLNYLNCAGTTDFTALADDVKANLIVLNCANANLDELDLQQYPSLTDLICDYNNLTSLNVAACPELAYLLCRENRLTSLDLSAASSSFRYLACGFQKDNGNLILKLNENLLDKWEEYWASSGDNERVYLDTELITIKNKELSAALMDYLGSNKVMMDENGYAVMIPSVVADVRMIELDYRSLTSLSGIEHFKNLTELSCSNNQLTSLDVSALVNLTRLHCHNNRMTELDLSACISDRIDLRCGGQGSDEQPLTLTLKLTSAMKDYWYSSLVNEHDNRRVVLAPGDDVYIPSLPKEDWE